MLLSLWLLLELIRIVKGIIEKVCGKVRDYDIFKIIVKNVSISEWVKIKISVDIYE